MAKASKYTKPLLILDVENLQVTTHAVIPTGNSEDIISYKLMLINKINKKQETLKTENIRFPHVIQQCSKWASLIFSTFYSELFNSLSEFMHAPEAYLNLLIAKPSNINKFTLEIIENLFLNNHLTGFADCVDLALNLFQELFVNSIQELVHQYPKRSVGEDGKPFWNNLRRFPTPIYLCDFVHDEMTQIFITSAAKLFSNFFQFVVPDEKHRQEIVKSKIRMSSQCQVPTLNEQLEGVVGIGTNEIEKELLRMKELVRGKNFEGSKPLKNLTLKSTKFQAEISDFIFSASNLRAMNFDLNLTKKYKAEHIAFNVTPNLEQINSIAASLSVIDILKICTVSLD